MLLSKTIKYINYILAKLRRDAVGAYSAQAALFLIVSFFPFVMLLLSLLRFLPWNETDMQNAVAQVVPSVLNSWAEDIVLELYQKSSGALVSVAAITTLWAASKGIHVLIKGYDSVYDVETPRNYLWQRSIAVFFTLIFLLALVFAITLLVFGNTIYQVLLNMWPVLEKMKVVLNLLRSIGAVLILTLLFAVMYTVFPRRKTKFRRELPGALISAVGWSGFSYLFSVYIDHFGNYSYLYGSIAAIVLFIIWLYFCMYITFVGAEVNQLMRHGMIAQVLTETLEKRKNK